MEADVVVIGGGMAGAVAALRAADIGADVLLIRKGHGSSAMSSGTIDIAGPRRFLPLDPWDSLPTVTDCLQEILRSKPAHPYSIIAGGRDGLEHLHVQLRNACDFVFQKIPSFRASNSNGHNLAIPSLFGTVKLSAYALPSLAAGNLLEMKGAHLLLVGIKGLSLFRPQICKQALVRFSSLHEPEAIANIDVIEADIPGTEGMPLSTPFEIARRLDDLRTAEEFARAINDKIQPGVTHIGFPPVLGLDNYSDTYATLCRELKANVFELISPNFSVPGYRLQASLDAALREGSIRVLTAEVVGAERDGRLARNLLLDDALSQRTVSAKKYILASGKFSAGGLVADDFPRETIFGLPLFVDCKRVDGVFLQDLLDHEVDAKQRILSCGIHVDRSLRPLDAFGEPAYENLLAAGSVIGEYDYVAEKCGLGVAMLTGYIAGENAAKPIESESQS